MTPDQLQGALVGFVQTHVGVCTDYDGYYGCQCVDLADAWGATIGAPLPLVVGAKDFAYREIPGYNWINDGAGPQPGDLVVWSADIYPANGNGHVAICTQPARNGVFQSLDQNWYNSGPMGSPAAYVMHDFYAVLGYQRPITQEVKPKDMPEINFPSIPVPANSATPIELTLGVNTTYVNCQVFLRGTGTINPDRASGTVYAVDYLSGAPLWEQRLGPVFAGAGAVANVPSDLVFNLVFVPDNNTGPGVINYKLSNR